MRSGTRQTRVKRKTMEMDMKIWHRFGVVSLALVCVFSSLTGATAQKTAPLALKPPVIGIIPIRPPPEGDPGRSGQSGDALLRASGMVACAMGAGQYADPGICRHSSARTPDGK